MKISVAICTYNGEKFLKEQIDSILNQTLKVDEIIVCDDGSKDSTIKILEKYASENPNLFQIHKNEINLRSVKNFEKAISLCTGDIIFLSDQDDIWVENKVAEYVDYFNKNTDIDVLASNGFCIDEKGNVHEKYAIWDVPQFLREKNIVVDYFKLISYVENIATGASMAFRKKIVVDIIPFPTIKEFHHDEWIALVASNCNAFEMLNNKYFYYRIHDDQQVGGVFFDKNENEKLLLTEIFDFNKTSISLKAYKRRLKKLCASFAKSKIMIEISNSINYKNISSEIAIKYNKTKIDFKKSHFAKYVYITISDSILNKRVLNK